MGVDYPCGCRTSAGHYFPCPYHEMMLINEWTRLDTDKKYLEMVEKANKMLREVL
jgi:hypothetical protein